LGLVIDENLSWHCHIDQMIPKLNKASYVIRFLKPLLSLDALKMVYFSTFHSIISYGIIFWGVSTYSEIISCGELFKKLCILPLQSQYVFSLLMFVVKNKDSFKTNLDIHSFNTISNHDLHIPVANLAVFQKGVGYSGIKVYNHLPPSLKQLSHVILKFKMALK
jgi:hypothetical protein